MRLSVAAVLLLLLLWPAAAPAHEQRATVKVTMTGFHFVLSRTSVPRGLVVFELTNKGQFGHDFRIGGRTSAMLAPGAHGTLVVSFPRPGRFPYICAVPGHARAGMKGVLRVT